MFAFCHVTFFSVSFAVYGGDDIIMEIHHYTERL